MRTPPLIKEVHVLISWVARVVTIVARGAAKKMIVKKLQTIPS
jgi:hypothetical protein